MKESDISRVIEMAWEDRTPFDAIEAQFGLNEQAVKELMRSNLKRSSYQLWRKELQAEAPNILLKGVSLLDVINLTTIININHNLFLH